MRSLLPRAGTSNPVLLLLGVALASITLLFGAAAPARVARESLEAVLPFSGGLAPTEHAFSWFHVRWYPVTLVFLAFTMPAGARTRL